MRENKELIAAHQQLKKLHEEMLMLLDQIGELQASPNGLSELDSESLSQALSSRKSEGKVNYDDLALQTDISTSTLKRLISDPDKTSFGNVVTVARELGVKLWLEP